MKKYICVYEKTLCCAHQRLVELFGGVVLLTLTPVRELMVSTTWSLSFTIPTSFTFALPVGFISWALILTEGSRSTVSALILEKMQRIKCTLEKRVDKNDAKG